MTRYKNKKSILPFRSKKEYDFAQFLKENKIKNEYETVKITYTQPSKTRTYTPDFKIKNSGKLIEYKGRYTLYDRQKHVLIKKQYPDLQLAIVFQNPEITITKSSKTTYALWCDKNNIMWFADTDRAAILKWLKSRK